MYRFRKTRSQGFTLVEMVVAVFIFGSVVLAVSLFSVYYLRNTSFSIEEAQQVTRVQNAHTRMIRELREARMGDDGSWPFLLCDDFAITFFADVTNDGRPDKIRYFLEGTTLRRGVTEPTAVPVSYPPANEKIISIADNVVTSGGPMFLYYNGDWPDDIVNNPLPTAQRILNTRYIRVQLGISITDNFAAGPFFVRSGVAIRTLKTNL